MQDYKKLVEKTKKLKVKIREEKLNKEKLRIKYLGKKGLLKKLFAEIKTVEPSKKKEFGAILNEVKNDLEKYLKEFQKTTATKNKIDLSLPAEETRQGHLHPISQAINEISQIFKEIGFTRVRYPEVDWDHYVFETLNMPKNHPARDEWETFFVDQKEDKKMGKVVLTTHTSNGQVREIERLNHKPPIRMINISRCYRRQQDATHTQMFHQFEGLVIDKDINLQHLKGTLDYFAEKFYGPGTKSRIRPFHFKFTEPSLEVDFTCQICKGSGKITNNEGKKEKCRFCKSGWHEVGGAGMVHPNVLKAGGIDPKKYRGFAFGWGVERTYTLKKGLNVDDIRLFYSGNLEFLKQF